MLSSNQQQQQLDEKKIAELELIASNPHPADADPLSVHDQLCTLLQGHPKRLLPVLERATRSFLNDARYVNDHRHLRLWLMYAKHVRQPLDIFTFLHDRSMFPLLAEFYEEWSWCVLRNMNDYQEAERILKRGLERNAQPVERLLAALNELSPKVNTVLPSQPTMMMQGRPSYSQSSVTVNQSWTSGLGAKPTTINKMTTTKREIPRYKLDDPSMSFEQLRAVAYRLLCVKTISNQPTDMAMELDSDDDSDQGHVNPDDLTHITVYKDTTADVREMARLASASAGGLNGGFTAVNGVDARDIPNHNQNPNACKTLMENVQRINQNAPILHASSDGTNNQSSTVVPVLIGSGKYFLERKLGSRTFLAVDLLNDTGRVVIKRASHEELAMWHGVKSDLMPVVFDSVAYTDTCFVICKYYEMGSLQELISKYDAKHQPIDSRVVLFYTRCLLQMINNLHSSGLSLGKFGLSNILLKTSDVDLDTVYRPDGSGGWTDRQLVFTALPCHTNGMDQADFEHVKACIMRLLHVPDPSMLSGQWSHLFSRLTNNNHGSITQTLSQIDAVLGDKSQTPSLRALLVRQEMMLME